MPLAVRQITELQQADDFTFSGGAGDDGKFIKWNNGTSKFVMDTAGVSNHSGLSELDYASAGHTDFARTSDTNTFAGVQTFSTSAVINEDGDDADTRIEGLGDANLLYLDAGNDRVGIGVTNPTAKFQVNAPTATHEALILKSTDNDTTKRIMEVHERFGGKRLGISAAGQVGIGQGHLTTSQLHFGGTWAYTAIVNVSTILNPSSGEAQTLRMVAQLQPQQAMSNVYGLNLNTKVGGSSSHNITDLYSAFTKYTLENSYGGTVTSAYGIFVDVAAVTSSGSPTITTNYGLRVKNQTVGASNFAIFTELGSVEFGDDVLINGSGAADVQLIIEGAASQSADIFQIHDSSQTEKLDIDQEGIIDFQGTMANSALDPTSDAPADWVEVEIGGTNYFLPAYAAS